MWPRLPNVRLLITVVNQEEADRDIPKLLAIPCKNGISYEPAIGPVDWWPWLYPICDCGSIPVDHNYAAAPCPRCAGRGCNGADRLDWIIIGGESSQPGHTTRPFNVEWARSTIEQCRTSKVPVFVKQLGSNPVFPLPGNIIRSITVDCQGVHDRAGANPAEWPEDLRIQEFPA